VDVSRLALDLKERRILVAARRGHLRVSPHYYNNEADLEKLGGALRDRLREGRK
jgi:selenocysteine lyase/cysteine desulfurase